VSDGRSPSGGGGGRLSPQTLVVASLASLTAAIVTSHFWRGGTPITAAITPVIVALASELYRRPAERITQLGSRATAVRGAQQRERVLSGPPAALPDPAARTEVPEGSGPIRVYRTPSNKRRFHAKVVAITAAVAFAIAIAVLTLPELVFGGSLASHGRTTFFGGGSSHHGATSTQSTTTITTKSTEAKSSSTVPTATVTVPAPAQQVPQTTTTQAAPPLGASGPTGP
jgi:hypothetical protein